MRWGKEEADQNVLGLKAEKNDSQLVLGAPVVPVGVGWRLLPALVGFGVQQTVVGVDGVAQVVPVVLLAC